MKGLIKDKTGRVPDYEYENNDKNEDAVNFSNFDSVWNHGIRSISQVNRSFHK